jgi:hypothetical protein
MTTVDTGHPYRDVDGLIWHHDKNGELQHLTLAKLRSIYAHADIAMYATMYRAAKFYEVGSRTQDSWLECHAWTAQHIGRDNYTWTGGIFWFDDPENAVMFKLAWG